MARPINSGLMRCSEDCRIQIYPFRTREKMDWRPVGKHRRFPRKRAPSCGQWDELTEKSPRIPQGSRMGGGGALQAAGSQAKVPPPESLMHLVRCGVSGPYLFMFPLDSNGQRGLTAAHEVPMTSQPENT